MRPRYVPKLLHRAWKVLRVLLILRRCVAKLRRAGVELPNLRALTKNSKTPKPQPLLTSSSRTRIGKK